MKLPEPTAILLDDAVELLFEIYLLRGDCSAAAREYTKQGRLDERSLEDCARLDDALAKTYRNLQSTIRSIQASRGLRRDRAC